MVNRSLRRAVRALLTVLAAIAVTTPVIAFVEPEMTPVREREMRNPDLHIPNVYRSLADLPGAQRAALALDLATLGVPADGGYLDARSGRWGTLRPSEPLIPGTGKGNTLDWRAFGGDPGDRPGAMEQAVWSAFTRYLRSHRTQLGIDLAQLAEPGRVSVHEGGALAHVHATRRIGGVPVRDSYVTAAINHGNLVLMGTRNWGDVDVATTPSLAVEDAVVALERHLGSIAVDGYWRKPRLELVPTARGTLETMQLGQGYRYRLAWVLSPRFDSDLGRWEGLIDAHGGEVLAFQDTTHYATTRNVVGGVYPISNDGIGPEGTEQAGFPMPWIDLDNAGVGRITDAGGNLNLCVDGTVTSAMAGRYIAIADTCGAASESTAGTLLDFGTSGGTDCTVPAGHSVGDTHAARSGFYELNRIAEQARAYLPANPWLDDQLTAVMNIVATCNASWNGTTVNFFRSGGGCRNTGEIAGIFDHEWGHGMDNNDVTGSVSSPGEGIADIYASLRLNTSCIGRGFFMAGVCGGYGDPCVNNCSGVRDIDWANRQSGAPHDLAWIDANCGAGGATPCGGSTHCEGAVYAESVWDLWNRDLTAAPFSFSLDTAREIATRLTFLGATPVGNWYSCNPGTGTGDGCNADGGYLNYLAADDDNGDVNDGTPHMEAIFEAFDRHGIACSSPTLANTGCAGAPTSAPAVTAVAIDRGASLSWGAVAGASKYAIYRTEGIFGCSFGKEKVGETTDTDFIDEGLANGVEYYYMVAAIGPHDACIGPMSSCTSVTPAAGANMAVDAAAAALSILTGDGDPFLDNCEVASVNFPIFNTGTGSITNVQVVNVVPVSHPGIVIDTALPSTVAASLSACASAVGSFSFVPGVLAFDDILEFRVDVTSDELAGRIRSQTVSFNVPTESDLDHLANKVFNFETGMENWSVQAGTFTRTNTGGGGNGTAFYLASSAFLDDQCDQVQSPIVALGANSTMSLYNSFGIEPFAVGPNVWYDRANIGVVDVVTGNRTPVSPDSGRLYNASGVNGNCGTDGQPGWAGSFPAWAQSSFSAAALGSGGLAGDLLRLAVHYGTDPAANDFGFHFDQVRLTNIDLQKADTQPNACASTLIFTDGFESGDLSRWSSSVP